MTIPAPFRTSGAPFNQVKDKDVHPTTDTDEWHQHTAVLPPGASASPPRPTASSKAFKRRTREMMSSAASSSSSAPPASINIWKIKVSEDPELDKMERRFEERPFDAEIPVRIAIRYFDVRRYESARKFLRLAVANGASSVEVWRLKAQVNVLLHKDGHGQGGAALEEALTDLVKATQLMGRLERRVALLYMEVAAIAYPAHNYDAMSRALGYVIVGFGGSVYGPMAMHLAAQLLFMDQQYAESLAYYKVLVIKPPQYSYDSWLDLLPPLVYDYSVTLEAGLLYERLGLWGLALEAYASILQQLRHASDPSMLHMGPPDRAHSLQAEPFPPEWQRLPLHAWVECAAVWRARAEDYVKARSYIMAAALYRKEYDLHAAQFEHTVSMRAAKQREAALALLGEAQCHQCLRRPLASHRCALQALEWAKDDPITQVRCLPFLQPDHPKALVLQKAAKTQGTAAGVVQMAARRYIFYRRRGAKLLATHHAATQLQKTWRRWDTWNKTALNRMLASPLARARQLASTYKAARPAAKEQVNKVLEDVARRERVLRGAMRTLVILRRRHRRRSAIRRLQRVLRGWATRTHLRTRLAKEQGNRIAGVKEIRPDWGYEDGVEGWGGGWDVEPKAPAGKREVVLTLNCLAVRRQGKEGRGAWLPLGVASDAHISGLLEGSNTLVLSCAYMGCWEVRRLCRLLPSHCESLHTLLLCGVSLRADGLTALSGFVGSAACQLTTLGLRQCRVGHGGMQGVRALGGALAQAKCPVKRLFIENDETVGDEGVARLLPFLQLNRSLRHVALRTLGLTRAVIRFVVTTVLLLCPHGQLRILDLSGNCFDGPAVERLVRALWEHLSPGQQESMRLHLLLHDQRTQLSVEELEGVATRLVQCGFDAAIELARHKHGGDGSIDLYGKHSLLTTPPPPVLSPTTGRVKGPGSSRKNRSKSPQRHKTPGSMAKANRPASAKDHRTKNQTSTSQSTAHLPVANEGRAGRQLQRPHTAQGVGAKEGNKSAWGRRERGRGGKAGSKVAASEHTPEQPERPETEEMVLSRRRMDGEEDTRLRVKSRIVL